MTARISGPVCHNPGCTRPQKGYGRITVDKTGYMAHRIAYVRAYGAIPEGLVIDHLCRNHSCVNPDHLEPVTSRTNVVVRGTGITARFARVTHCPQGHEYTLENTIFDGKGRQCRTCSRDRAREHNRRLRGFYAR